MTREHLKNLRPTDFQAPNQVLCYGGGGAFQSVVPYLVTCGFNIVGVIDAGKGKQGGTVVVKGHEIPYFSLEDAIAAYGTSPIVIITIASYDTINQVKEILIGQGFSENRIFDMNVYTWLTVPAENCYCKDLAETIQVFPSTLSSCCNPILFDGYLCEWFIGGRTTRESFDHYIEKHAYYLEEMKQGRVPLYCRDCPLLSRRTSEEESETIKVFQISDHVSCNCDCVYCGEGCSAPKRRTMVPVEERHDAILYALEAFQRHGILDRRAIIQMAGGELTINPCRQMIYEALRRAVSQSPERQLIFYSNCFIYSQEIADLLTLGRDSYIQCDLDAGTPQTYIKVKGFNRFEVVCKHLKQYTQFGTVVLKYVVMPGWNDSQEDYEGTIALMKELNIRQLTLSPEFSVVQEGSRRQVRETLYAAARFKVLLEQNGMRALLRGDLWKKEHATVIERLCHEIRTLG